MTALRDRGRAAWYLLFALALAFGAFVRCWQLGDQILLDDEWHAINRLLSAGAGEIATHFGLADYSIPLTLYYRLLYLHGGLTECGMRLPMLLAGLGLLLAGPRLVRASFALPARTIWVGLMAISPLLTYHTRTARPYAITTLLCFVAIVAFRRWWQHADRRLAWAAGYAAATFLAGWLHLIALTFALAPFLWYGAVALRDCITPSRRAAALRALRDLVVLGLAVVVPLAAALVPPLLGDWHALAAKTGTDAATLDSVYRTFLICFGSASPWLLAAFIVLLAFGAVSIARRDRDLLGYLGFVVVVSIAAIIASKAAWLQHPLNLARYIQPLVPILLLVAADGAAVLLARLRPEPLPAAIAAVALAGLYFAGPMPGYLYDPNQFMGDPYFQADYDPRHNPYHTRLPDGPIPSFYRELRLQPPRSLTLIEMPWSLETPYDPQPLYQAVHRQLIKIALTTPECGVLHYGNYPASDSGMQLAHFVHLSDLLDGADAGGDFLVVHLHAWPDPRQPPPEWPDIANCMPAIERHLGAPVWRDDEIEVFALSPVGRVLAAGFTAAAGMR